MPGYQQTIIIGNVGRDPEIRYTPQGVAVCDFSVAVNRDWTDRSSGEKVSEVTWFRVTCWRALAEFAGEYVEKGRQVMVAGRVGVSAYLSPAGEPRATLELTATELQLLGTRGDVVSEDEAEREDVPF